MTPALAARTASPLLALLALPGFAGGAAAQTFEERAAALGLVHQAVAGFDKVGILNTMNDWCQIGVAMGDLDSDADQDLICLGRFQPNHVYRNDGGAFTDVTALTGFEGPELETCIALGDVDRDGDLDVYVGTFEPGVGAIPGHNRLLSNLGAFAFADVSARSGARGNGHSLAAKFLDIDADGMLDLYVSEFLGTASLEYRNNGDGSFREVGAANGSEIVATTHVTAIFDSDGDGYPDLFPGHDYKVADSGEILPNPDDMQLARQGDGTWLDVSAGSGIELVPAPYNGASTMAIAVGDVDYDGDFDLYKTLVGPQALQLNNGWPGSGVAWTYADALFGVTNDPVEGVGGFGKCTGWGATFADLDFDGWLDLFKVNGKVSGAQAIGQRDAFFAGQGPEAGFHFVEKTLEYGFEALTDDRSLCVGDLDGDLDLDLIVSGGAGPMQVWENRLDKTGLGTIAVRVKTGTSNPQGTRVTWIDPLGLPHVRVIDVGAQTASQDQLVAFFAIGSEPSADLEVRFQSGMTKLLADVPANSSVLVEEPQIFLIPSRQVPWHGSAASAGAAPAPFSGVGGSWTEPQHLFEVKVAAYTAAGIESPRAKVEIEVEGLDPVGPVQHVADHVFRRLFREPDAPGGHAVTARIGTWTVGIHPVIWFVGPASPATSLTTFEPVCVRAGSGDPWTVTCVPRDANGIPVVVEQLEVEIPGLLPKSLLMDLGGGAHGGTFSAPATTGFKTLESYVDGVQGPCSGVLEVAGNPNGPKSALYTEVPFTTTSLSKHLFRFSVTPKDGSFRRLGPKANVVVVVTPDAGTEPVAVKSGLGPNNQADGEFWFVLERSPSSPIGSATGTVRVYAEQQVLIKTFTYAF
jgi:hypothetical protein